MWDDEARLWGDHEALWVHAGLAGTQLRAHHVTYRHTHAQLADTYHSQRSPYAYTVFIVTSHTNTHTHTHIHTEYKRAGHRETDTSCHTKRTLSDYPRPFPFSDRRRNRRGAAIYSRRASIDPIGFIDVIFHPSQDSCTDEFSGIQRMYWVWLCRKFIRLPIIVIVLSHVVQRPNGVKVVIIARTRVRANSQITHTYRNSKFPPIELSAISHYYYYYYYSDVCRWQSFSFFHDCLRAGACTLGNDPDVTSGTPPTRN